MSNCEHRSSVASPPPSLLVGLRLSGPQVPAAFYATDAGQNAASASFSSFIIPVRGAFTQAGYASLNRLLHKQPPFQNRRLAPALASLTLQPANAPAAAHPCSPQLQQSPPPAGAATPGSNPSQPGAAPKPITSVPVPASTERRPLLPAERASTRTTVCVTGATGYIGSRAVERLLAGGHRVHAVVLPEELEAGGEGEATRHLTELPGAAQRLRLFPGDVCSEGSGGVGAALAGCGALLHLAAVVDLLPAGERRGLMVDTATRGSRRVLDSVAASGSCRRVVLSSSVAAVVGDNWERGANHVYDERDWAQDCAPGYNTYSHSKSVSERLSYEWAAQNPGIRLVTINPGVVFGPVRIRRHALTSPGMIKGVLDGSPVLDLHSAFADVDDVAAVLCAALMQPQPQKQQQEGGVDGRHILASECCGLHEVAGRLRALYPTFQPHLAQLPRWLVAAVPGWLWRSFSTDAAVVRATLGKPLRLDTSKTRTAFGLTAYTPLDVTLRDCAASLMELGLVPEHKPAPAPGAAAGAGGGAAAAGGGR